MRNSILNGCGVHSDKLIEISEMLIKQKTANGEKVIEKDVWKINTQIFEAYQIILSSTNDSNIIAKSIVNLKESIEKKGNVENIISLSIGAVQKAIETTNKPEVEMEESIKKELILDLREEDKTKDDNMIEDRDEKFQKISEYFETILDSYFEEDSEKVYSNRVNEIMNLFLKFKNNEFNEGEFIKFLKEGAINLIYEKKYGQQDGYEKIEEILKEVVKISPEKKDFFDENGKINLKKIETEYELLIGEKLNIEEAVEKLKNAVQNYSSDDFTMLAKYLDIIDEYDLEKCQQLGGKLLKAELKNNEGLIESICDKIRCSLEKDNERKNVEGIAKILEINYTIYSECEGFLEEKEKKMFVDNILISIRSLPENLKKDFYNKYPEVLEIEEVEQKERAMKLIPFSYKENDNKNQDGQDKTDKLEDIGNENLEYKKEKIKKTQQSNNKEQGEYNPELVLINAILGKESFCFPGEEEFYEDGYEEDVIDELEEEEIEKKYKDLGAGNEVEFLKSIGVGLAKQERKEENDGKRDMVDENGDLILDDGDDELKLVEDEDYKEMSAEEAEKFCKNLGIDYPNEFNKSINENSGPDDLELEEEDSDFKDSDMEKLYQQIEEFENEEIENIEKNLKQKIEEYNFKPNEKILEEISYYQEQLKNFSNNKIQTEAPESLESMLKGKLEEYNETFDINLLKEIEELQNQIRLNEGKNFENISNKGIDKEEVSIREEDDDDAR